MKLHKLLYAAQGVHLAQHGTAEFDSDEVQAWRDGPVVPSVYETFRGRLFLNRNDLGVLGNEAVLDPSESDAVDRALDLYGAFSGDALSQMSHAEAPWHEAWHGRGRNSPLDPVVLTEFFRERLQRVEATDPEASAERLLTLLGDPT
jgi:uncharacterized phage-associated protein